MTRLRHVSPYADGARRRTTNTTGALTLTYAYDQRADTGDLRPEGLVPGSSPAMPWAVSRMGVTRAGPIAGECPAVVP
jgi:hypothetical protein